MPNNMVRTGRPSALCRLLPSYPVARQIQTNNNFLPFVKSLFDLEVIVFIFAIPTGVMNLSW